MDGSISISRNSLGSSVDLIVRDAGLEIVSAVNVLCGRAGGETRLACKGNCGIIRLLGLNTRQCWLPVAERSLEVVAGQERLAGGCIIRHPYL